jgi:hypothetical protein
VSKKKPKRRYQVVIDDPRASANMDKEKRDELADYGIKIATALLPVGVAVMLSPTVGYLIFIGGLAGIWSLVIWKGAIKSRKVCFIGYGVLLVIAVVMGLCLRFSTSKSGAKGVVNTQQPVTVSAPNSPGSTNVGVGTLNGPLNVDKSVHATPEAELYGILMPANEPDPFRCRETVPVGALKVFMGSNVAWINKMGYQAVLRIAHQDRLAVKRTGGGLYVSAWIKRPDGRDVAIIVENHFAVNPNNYCTIKRPDRHELQVFDKTNDLILKVRYINEMAIILEGTFYSLGQFPYIITRDEIKIGNLVFSGLTVQTIELE